MHLSTGQQFTRLLTCPDCHCKLRRPSFAVASRSAAPGLLGAKRRSLQVHAAKKGGKGGGKQKQQKQSAIPQAGAAVLPWRRPEVIMHNLLLVESFSRIVGRPIMEDVEIADASKALYEAPFAMLAHEFSEAGAEQTEPSFVYANQVALDLFETSWDELIGQPSSVSADPEDHADRGSLVEAARQKGFVDGVTGWRRSLKGSRFKLIDAILFNVISPGSEDVLGQAVLIEEWEREDGSREGPNAAPPEPTAADLAAAEAAVADQAEAVRELKEGQGLTNKDEPVVAAVEELLKRKQHVTALQEALEQLVV